jgi:hypothetical protein
MSTPDPKRGTRTASLFLKETAPVLSAIRIELENDGVLFGYPTAS